MLLTFRADFVGEYEFVSAKDAKLVEEELNKNPPIDRRLILPQNTYLFKVSGKEPEPDPEPWLREPKAAEQGDASEIDKPSN